MKKTLSLVGLLFVGLMLLANPATGILAALDPEPTVVVAEPTTTESGDPPPDTDDEEATATTVETPVTTTEPVTNSYSIVGSVEDSKFGSFQVEVFFEADVIVAVEALQLPSDRKSTAINNTAVPLYEEFIVDAQSTDIDVISGATITWDNYTASVQSALNEAGV